MEVKTESGGTFDAAGNGTKGLSIAGLVTGATALVGSGLLGAWGMNRNNNCNGGNWNGNNWGNYGNCHGMGFGGICWDPGKDYVTEAEFNMQKRFDEVNSALTKEKAERYADQAVIKGNERLYDFRKDIADAIVADRDRLSRIEGKLSCNDEVSALKERLLYEKIDAVRNEARAAVALESERRVNGDQGIFGYVNATFVPGKLIMPKNRICPEPMDRYNSWTAPVTAAAEPVATN